MPPVFGRSQSDPHPYDAALAQWLADGRIEVRAVARNTMHDHRVSEAREQHFDAFANRPRTGPHLRQAFLDYFRERVRHLETPDFLDERLNGPNIVSGGRSGQHVVNRDLEVARVLDLSGLGLVFEWARKRRIGGRTFARYPKNPNDVAVAAWLEAQLSGRSHDDRAKFVSDTLAALDAYGATYPFQPTWIVFWAEIQPHLAAGPDRWLELVGVSKASSPRWLIVLKYRLRDGGTVARPTVLDAGGWTAHHFPSPPQTPLGFGGHPMDLSMPALDPPVPFVSEFIHQEVRHTITQWEEAGSWCAPTTGPSPEALEAQRVHHHQRLRQTYGSTVDGWMPSPV